jgi:hypothetical protein
MRTRRRHLLIEDVESSLILDHRAAPLPLLIHKVATEGIKPVMSADREGAVIRQRESDNRIEPFREVPRPRASHMQHERL